MHTKLSANGTISQELYPAQKMSKSVSSFAGHFVMAGKEKKKEKKYSKRTKCHCKISNFPSRLQRKMTKAMNNSEKFSSEK